MADDRSKNSSLRITDPLALRALAHPFRRRLLDSLSADGPATVGQLAERTGQAIGSVSHHLKALRSAQLVAPAPELARDQRESWWRRVDSISWGGVARSAAERSAVDAATDVVAERQWQLLNDYRRNADSLPDWQDASFATDGWLTLTPAELHALGEELREVVNRWREHSDTNRGQDRDDATDRTTVFYFLRGFPARP